MESLDIKELLKLFGLTDTETMVFSELNYLGVSSIGNLIKRTYLHRGTVYNTLQRLKERGLISINIKGNMLYYCPNPNGFLSLIEEERVNLEKKKEIVERIKECATYSRCLNKDNDLKVYLLEGKSAFKGFFLDLVNNARKNDEAYLYLGNGGDMRDKLGGDYYVRSQKIKTLLESKCKVILNINKKTHPFSKEVRGTLKWLPEEYDFSTVDTWVYNGKVVIVDWKSNPLNTVVIENKNVANNYKMLWKNLWNQKAVKQEEAYNIE